MTDSPVTLVIDTAFGVLVRRIAGASPLPAEIPGGTVVEDAIRDAAATWGLPDFVYRAQVIQKGRGSRQIGDNILIVGDLGMVVQATRREGSTHDAAKERRWLEKNAATALAQAHGTIRTLRANRLRLTNHRERSIEVDGSEIWWLAVAVLEHPDPPRDVVPETDGANPAIVLVRRDWEFLFNQLKSTYAVGRYIERVVGEPWELGGEPSRYFQLAQADARTRSGPVKIDIFGRTGRLVGGPMLPIEPAASGEDELPHLFLRSLIEDIATGPRNGVDEERRVHVLAELDRLAVSTRAAMGTYLLKSMELAAAAPPGQVIWRHRQYTNAQPHAEGRPVHLAFGTCSHPWDDVIQGMFTTWVSLRHHQMGEALGDHEDLTTVGICVTPRTDGRRPWDTSMIAAWGNLDLDPDDIQQWEGFWPTPDEPVKILDA